MVLVALPMLQVALVVALILQGTGSCLLGRYTRLAVPTKELYDVNNFILVSECVKLLLSGLVEASHGRLLRGLREHVLEEPSQFLKSSVPALLYLISNTSLYMAITHLSLPLQTGLSQARLIVVAVMSYILLNRIYSLKQWCCLATLSAGVTMVALSDPTGSARDTDYESPNLLLGLSEMCAANVCSSAAGVYFEKVLKEDCKGIWPIATPLSMWVRNLHLSFFSLAIGILAYGWRSCSRTDAEAPMPFFHGFSVLVWTQVGLLAGGGLLASAVMKYADSVTKAVTTAVGTGLIAVVSIVFLEAPVTLFFLVGVALTIGAVYLFSNPFRTWFLLPLVCLVSMLLISTQAAHIHRISLLPLVKHFPNTNFSSSYMWCRGQRIRALSDMDDDCIHGTPKSNKPNVTVDIMSGGSKNNIQMLTTQANTMGSHSSVRFFFAGTEDDDADPTCSTRLTKAQMINISNFCRKFLPSKYPAEKEENKLIRYMLKSFAHGEYLADKPPGWMCANSRVGVGYSRIGRMYKAMVASGGPEVLPEYVILLDDDGYYNMDWFLRFAQETDPSIPAAYAGCLIESPHHIVNFSFPFGGFGTVLSRGTILNLIRPLHCRGGGLGMDGFLNHACAQIQRNMFGEQESFLEGMSVSDLMGAHAMRANFADLEKFKEAKYPFCLHGDWTVGYYLNYYRLSNQIAAPWYNGLDAIDRNSIDRPQFRMGDFGKIYNKKTGNCLNDGDSKCDRNSEICHHLSMKKMKDLAKHAKPRQGN